MSNRLVLIIVFVGSLSIFGLKFGCSAPTELNSLKAIVNGEPITQVDLDEATRMQIQIYFMGNQGQVTAAQVESDIKKLEETALNDLIDRKLILSEFKTIGGTIQDKYVDETVNNFVKSKFNGNREEFLKALAKQGISLNQFRDVKRDEMAVQALQSRNTRDNGIGASLPAERDKVYDEIKHEHATEGKLKLRMLSIPKITPTSNMESQEKLIKSIRSKIINGASFSSMAKEHSQDSFASQGGYVGTVDRSTLNPRLTQIAYSLKTGTVSEVIDDGPGWRLMYVDGRVGQKTPSQTELADEVEKRIMIKKRQVALESWMKTLRKKANIRILN